MGKKLKNSWGPKTACRRVLVSNPMGQFPEYIQSLEKHVPKLHYFSFINSPPLSCPFRMAHWCYLLVMLFQITAAKTKRYQMSRCVALQSVHDHFQYPQRKHIPCFSQILLWPNLSSCFVALNPGMHGLTVRHFESGGAATQQREAPADRKSTV